MTATLLIDMNLRMRHTEWYAQNVRADCGEMEIAIRFAPIYILLLSTSFVAYVLFMYMEWVWYTLKSSSTLVRCIDWLRDDRFWFAVHDTMLHKWNVMELLNGERSQWNWFQCFFSLLLFLFDWRQINCQFKNSNGLSENLIYFAYGLPYTFSTAHHIRHS